MIKTYPGGRDRGQAPPLHRGASQAGWRGKEVDSEAIS